MHEKSAWQSRRGGVAGITYTMERRDGSDVNLNVIFPSSLQVRDGHEGPALKIEGPRTSDAHC